MTAAARREQVIEYRSIIDHHKRMWQASKQLRPIVVSFLDTAGKYILATVTTELRRIGIRKAEDIERVTFGENVVQGANAAGAQQIGLMNRVLNQIGAAAMQVGYNEHPVAGVKFGVGFDIGEDTFRRIAWVKPYKGLGSDISKGIDKIVQTGVAEGKSLGVMRKEIQSSWANVSRNKANLIIRSESTRYQNTGLLGGYDLNPVVGAKSWVATLDNDTRAHHRRISLDRNIKIVLLDEYFQVPRPGYPQLVPSEPHCRCRVNSVVDEGQIRKAYEKAGRTYPGEGKHEPVGAATLPPNANYGPIEFNPIDPIGLATVNPYPIGFNVISKPSTVTGISSTTPIQTVSEQAAFQPKQEPAPVAPKPKAVPKAHQEAREQFRQAAEKADVEFAKAQGISVDEFRKQTILRMQELIDESDTFVRVHSDILEKVLKDGRFKNQFEVLRGVRGYDPKLRKGIEERVMGVARGVRNSNRPIYGTLSNSRTGGLGSELRTQLDAFGNATVKLKRSTTRTRTTFTIGDSLEKQSMGIDVIADPMSRVSMDVLDKSARSKLLPGKPKWNPFEFTAEREFRYAEAQVHGGIKLSDIDTVFLRKVDISDDILELLTEHKVNYEIIP